MATTRRPILDLQAPDRVRTALITWLRLRQRSESRRPAEPCTLSLAVIGSHVRTRLDSTDYSRCPADERETHDELAVICPTAQAEFWGVPINWFAPEGVRPAALDHAFAGLGRDRPLHEIHHNQGNHRRRNDDESQPVEMPERTVGIFRNERGGEDGAEPA